MQLELDQLDLRYGRLRITDAARQGRLLSSLASEGQLSPVLVIAADEAGRYVLIDGYARTEALHTLAQDLVEATVLEVEEAEALMLCHGLRGSRRRTALEEGWLIKELVERHGLERREISARLGRSPSWVSRRLSLVQVLPEPVQKAVRDAAVPPYAAMKFLVPLARANAEQCVSLVGGLGDEGVSARQVERLYVGWRQGDAETRERIVEQPRLFLRASDPLGAGDAGAGDSPAEVLLRDLEMVSAIAHRARRRLRAGHLEQLDGKRRPSIHRAVERARLAFEALSELLAQESPDAGSRHPHGSLQAA